jgi:signal transduction histidine kinase
MRGGRLVIETPPLRRLLLEFAVVTACLCDALLVVERYDLPTWISSAGALIIPLRHRFPTVVLLVSLPGAGTRQALLPAALALFALCRTGGSVRDTLPFTLLTALALLVPWPPGPVAVLEATGPQLVEAIVYAVAFTIAPVAAGWLGATKAELQAKLTELSHTKQREQELRSAQAVSAERTRIAREMHDVVAHAVSLIAVQAGALQVSSSDGKVRDTAGQLRQLSVRTLTELRAMVGVLRAAAGDSLELAPQPTLADLPKLADDAGFPVTLHLDGQLANGGRHEVPAPVQRAAYRTVQEALTNVRKHASGAPAVVTVNRNTGALNVEIVNAAPAHPPAGQPPSGGHGLTQLPSGGHGLTGLRERVGLLGGGMSAGRTSDGGFRLRASFPIRA